MHIGSGPARLFVRELGHGPPLIVVHGWPDFDHSYLAPEVDRMADRCRLVYYDQRGRGRSYRGRVPEVTIASEVDDLDRVRRHARCETVSLLGHSWGGLLAAEYAVRHPDRVAGLILVNTAPVSHAGIEAARRHMRGLRTAEERERLAALESDARYLAGDLGADAERHRIHFAPAVRRPEDLEAIVGRLRTSFSAESIVAARAIEDRLYDDTWNREDYDLVPRLADLPVPTLVVHGDRDFLPQDDPRRIARAMPDARLVVLSDCGHFATVEHPDEVADLVARFVSSVTPGRPGPARRSGSARTPRP